MRDLYRRGGLLARENTVYEITIVVFAFVKMNFVLTNLRIEERFRGGVVLPSIRPNPALGSLPSDSTSLFV
jgi:hypothetical protein